MKSQSSHIKGMRKSLAYLSAYYVPPYSFRGAPMRCGSETKPRVHRVHFPFPGTNETAFPSALASREGHVPCAANRVWAGRSYPPPRLAMKHPIQSFSSHSGPPGREQGSLRRGALGWKGTCPRVYGWQEAVHLPRHIRIRLSTREK